MGGDIDNQYYYNYTNSDQNGYYDMNVPSGWFELRIDADGYLYEYTDYFKIDENETMLINFSLYPDPEDSAIIQGYLKDKDTNMPIENAYIYLNWEDSLGHSYSNYTNSDQNGYYKMNVPVGKSRFYFNSGEYNHKTKEIDIKENEINWLNVSLKKYQISVNIEKPRRAIYINNQRFLPFLIPIIIGDIKIVTSASNYVNYVEFFIDGKLKCRDFNHPYECLYNDKYYLGHFHTLEIVGYSSSGSIAKDRLIIWKL